MTKDIEIFNPREKPYGMLSNDFFHDMRLEDKNWRTVTNFIYAHLFNDPTSRTAVHKMPTKELRESYGKLREMEYRNLVKKSITTALQVKFENEKLAQLLIETGNRPIIYLSDNRFLGVKVGKGGDNAYGLALEQLRHQLRFAYRQRKEQQAKEQRDQALYEIYLAYDGLVQEMKSGNDIRRFAGKKPSEIVDEIGRVKLEQVGMQRDRLLEQVHEGKMKHIEKLVDNSDHLVPQVRKLYLREMRKSKLVERENIVFDMYADYLLEKHYPDLDKSKYAQAKLQQFKDLSWTQRRDLEGRLFKLYQDGELSERLSNLIDERIASLNIPDEDEVEQAESVVLTYDDVVNDREDFYQPVSGEPVYVYPSIPIGDKVTEEVRKYVVFSPIAISMMDIDGKLYPTVTHYMVTKLIASIPRKLDGTGMPFSDAYEEILENGSGQITGVSNFLHPDEIMKIYRADKIIYEADMKRRCAVIALEKKFEDRVLQDVLLMTGRAKLIWNDYSDPVLGVGNRKQKGENYVGVYLMQLREEIRNQRKGETIHKFTAEHLDTVFHEDKIIKQWISMRVEDMCQVINQLRQHMFRKYEVEPELSTEFVTGVLDIVYQPCSQLFGATHLVNAMPTVWFIELVNRQAGFNGVDAKITQLLWARVVVMIYYLIEAMKVQDAPKLRFVLGQIEHLVSQPVKCTSYISNEFDNCILSALLNLIQGLNRFNHLQGKDSAISVDDIITATNIIVSGDATDEFNTVTLPARRVLSPVVPKGQKRPRQKPNDEKQPEETKDEVVSPHRGVTKTSQQVEDSEVEIEYMFPGDFAYSEDEELEFEDGNDVLGASIVGADGPVSSDSTGSASGTGVEINLVDLLSDIGTLRDEDSLVEKLLVAIEIVKTKPMIKKVRQNRINFFATQR